MEAVRTTFHAQLSSVMESLLAAAAGEIAKIFESSLHKQQAELLQKTKEIAILRLELGKVEGKCSESGTMGAAVDETPTSETKHVVKLEADPVSISADTTTFCQSSINSSVIKEEVDLNVAEECCHDKRDPESTLELETTEATEILFTIQQEPLSKAQSKNKALQWNQSILTAALHEEDALSLSVFSKVCSDTNQTEGLSRGFKTTQEPATEQSQTNEPIWSGAQDRDATVGIEDAVSDNTNGAFFNTYFGKPAYSHGVIHPEQRKGELKTRSRVRPPPHFHSLQDLDSDHQSDSGVTGRPYNCPYCTKCFAYPSHQRRHILRHTGTRLHSCQFCDKRFLTPSELTVHTRTHTGERPFGCGQCGKRFARSGNLRAHQRDVHLGKRPFSCTECGKKFAHKGNLRVHHHRVHQGQ